MPLLPACLFRPRFLACFCLAAGLLSGAFPVRYAWAQSPLANLYNKNGLPGSPFRTDDWNPKSSIDPVK